MASVTLRNSTIVDSAAPMLSNAAAEVAYLWLHHLDHPNRDGEKYRGTHALYS
jgi:hypothetical protein